MSTLESRELLIQQRQAEKYLNVIRLTLLFVLTAALAVRYWTSGLSATSFLPPTVVFAAWLYALFVQLSLSRGFSPRYLPWLTTVADLVFLTLGLILELSSGNRTFTVVSTSLTWGYALLFLLILFSTLRERPSITLVNGLSATTLYAGVVAFSFPQEPFPGFWTEQGFRLAFLLVAGLFSTFHARSVRKAFERVATSDRLRRETDSRLKVLALHFPGVLFQAELIEHGIQVRYVSEGSRELLGIDSRDLVADPGLFFSRAEPGLAAALRSRVDQGAQYRAWDQEFSYEGLDQGTIWLQMSVTTYHNPQGVLVVNGLVSDVSEQRKIAEALREANQAKTDFLATMSHELRTPLNAILGNADHLSRLADQDDDKKAFRDLQASGETLLGLIEDILVFSRLEAGRLTAEIRPFAWRPQFEGLLDSFRTQASAKGLSLDWRSVGDLPDILWTDGLRLRQIVGNLISNAVKFTPSGSILVTLVLELAEQGTHLKVEVADTGIGVPAPFQEKIFDKFTQGEHGKSRTYGGLGLGLAISRSLAELLGGTLAVASRPGEGSTFTLRIPARVGGALEVADLMGTEQLDVRSARVLLVEDNRTNQDVASRMLKKLGATVDVAPGGREAVAAVRQTFYDLILMDWQMPVMDGREATAKIRSLPGGQDLVIVALSGHALPGDRELLLASGFDDYLAKPVRMEDFRSTLAKWVMTPPVRG
jgi:signal transduction histidine kinase/ActR/RegA family two-component response regulator